MRAATEFFHKSSEGGPQNDQGALSLPPPRSVSPKKSVRFRSGTYSPDETKSSPINVPKKSAPTLPLLELPNAPFMNNIGPFDGDPIPTGRPPDTPMLKAKEKRDGYFPSTMKPGEFNGYPNSMHPRLPSRTKALAVVDPSVENPFEDSATITRVHARKWSPHMSRSTTAATAATADSESSASKKLTDLQSSTGNSNRTSETLYQDDRPQVEKIEHALDPLKAPTTAHAATLPLQEQKEQQDADFAMALQLQEEEEQRQGAERARHRRSVQGSLSKPDELGRAPIDAEYQPPSAQVSWAVVHAQPSNVRGRQHAKDEAVEQSLWTLASRGHEHADGDGYTSPSDDGDFRRRQSVSSRRSQRRQPTHEDIRRQFRASKAPAPFHWSEPLSASTASAAECEATFVTAMEEALTTDPARVMHTLRKLLSSDLLQPPSQATPRGSTSEQEVIVPEHAVSPLNLKSNVSSTSPSPTRRPFRFSNSTDKDPNASPIGNTSFSLHVKEADEVR